MNRIHTDSIVFPLRWAALSGEIVWVSERANTEGDETKTAAKSRSAEPEELADPVASFAIRSLSLRQRDVAWIPVWVVRARNHAAESDRVSFESSLKRETRSHDGMVSLNAKGDDT